MGTTRRTFLKRAVALSPVLLCVRGLAGREVTEALAQVNTSTSTSSSSTSSSTSSSSTSSSTSSSSSSTTVEGKKLPCPTAAEMLTDDGVSKAIDAAWTDSEAGDKAKRHEEGGWIVHNSKTGALRVVRVAAGGAAGLAPGAPPALGADEEVCGFFHTHPNPPVDEGGTKWEQGPSDADKRWHKKHKIPGIIKNAAGTETFGPKRGPYK